jgi:stage II sporulation protein AB (anti-sigma F factor)
MENNQECQKTENPAEEISVEMESRSCNEQFARVVIAVFLSRLDPTVEKLDDVKTAVSEAVTNCIIHGYGGKTGTIRLEARIEGREATIRVIDYGVGIPDVKKAMEPFFTTKPLEERSGMGFCFMEAFMDELEVISHPGEGTIVSMKKRL